MRFCSLFFALILPFASFSAPQKWTIGNGEISRTVTFSETSGLFTEHLSDLKTHVEFILPEKSGSGRASEFSFDCNDHTYQGAGSQFSLLSASELLLPNGKSLTIRLRSKELPLEVSVIYNVYDGHPAIRKQLILRNAGSMPLHFSHLNLESIELSVGRENETTLNTQYGTIPR